MGDAAEPYVTAKNGYIVCPRCNSKVQSVYRSSDKRCYCRKCEETVSGIKSVIPLRPGDGVGTPQARFAAVTVRLTGIYRDEHAFSKRFRLAAAEAAYVLAQAAEEEWERD